MPPKATKAKSTKRKGTTAASTSKPKSKSASSQSSWEASSGNVYMDLGFSAEQAKNMLVRSQLIAGIMRTVKENDWTPDEAIAHLKIDKDEWMLLAEGCIGKLTSDQLMTWVHRLGKTVQIKISN